MLVYEWSAAHPDRMVAVGGAEDVPLRAGGEMARSEEVPAESSVRAEGSMQITGTGWLAAEVPLPGLPEDVLIEMWVRPSSAGTATMVVNGDSARNGCATPTATACPE
jgi:hypothetical protein